MRDYNSKKQPKQIQNTPYQGKVNKGNKQKKKAAPKQEKNPFEGILKPKAKVQPKHSKTKEMYKQSKANKVSKSKRTVTQAENLKIIPIGGLNEIGKNFTVLEYKDQILIIDCGNSFPEEGMDGVDVVIPDFI